MHSFVLQDWTTIRGGAGVTSVTQTETEWLDLSPFQDVVFWIDVREVTNVQLILLLQTSPTSDDALFQPLIPGMNIVASSSPVVVQALMFGASAPLARFVRWQLTCPTTPWDATFRIVLAANAPGM
jgi:hypothetical protein